MLLYVKDFELPNAFVRAPVELGEQNDGYVEVKNGLFPGDEVVTQGSYSLGFAGGGSVSLKEALDAGASDAIHHWADCLTGINAQIGVLIGVTIESMEAEDAGS